MTLLRWLLGLVDPIQPARLHACGMCGRPLDVEGAPLSRNCAGDCWGCMGAAEFGGALPEDQAVIEREIRDGLRHADATAKDWPAA
jgi:hypothetical protein